jgi:hypothetical protein
MRLLNVLLILVLLAPTVKAQKNKNNSHPEKISVGFAYRFSKSYIAPELLVKYKVKQNSALRFGIGYQEETSYDMPIYFVNATELYRKDFSKKISSMFLGIGYEISKPLYKRLKYYYAIDTRIIKGNSSIIHSIYKATTNMSNNPFLPDPITNVKYTGTNLDLNVSPSIGLQFTINKFTFGFEKFIATTGFIKVQNNIPNNYSIFDLNIGNISNRFSVVYKL